MNEKNEIKKEIRVAKFAVNVAASLHGHNSPERKAALEKLWDLNMALGKIEIAELEAAHAAAKANH